MRRIAILVIIAAAVMLAPDSASAQVVYCGVICDVYTNVCLTNPEPEGVQCIQEVGYCWMKWGEMCHAPTRPRTGAAIESKWSIASIEIVRAGLPLIRTDASSTLASIEVKPQSKLR